MCAGPSLAHLVPDELVIKLKKWREALRADFDEALKKAADAEKSISGAEEPKKDENDSEMSEDEDLKKLEDEIDMLKDEERRGERRKKKKSLKEKRKTAERIDLKMIIPGDRGPTLQEEGLFKISDIKTTKDMKKVVDQSPETLEQDSDEDTQKKPKVEKYSKEKGKLDKAGLFYKDDANVSEEETDDEEQDSDDEYSEVDALL